MEVFYEICQVKKETKRIEQFVFLKNRLGRQNASFLLFLKISRALGKWG
jgi:hypothetical protein